MVRAGWERVSATARVVYSYMFVNARPWPQIWLGACKRDSTRSLFIHVCERETMATNMRNVNDSEVLT